MRHSESYPRTPTYVAWIQMKARCNNKKRENFENWGGRGISVCPEWESNYLQFKKDVGEKPGPKFSLDRINNNMGYEPNNCRWVTMKEQHQNKRNNSLLTFQGKTMCVTQWAELLGINHHTIYGRIKRGWTTEKTLTTQSDARYKRR